MDIGSDIKLIIESCKTTVDENSIISYIQEIKNWNDFISLAYSHGVFPLVYQTLKSYNNHISALVLTNMKKVNMDIVKLNMMMTSELIKVIRCLKINNISVICFKGPTLSKMLYGNITLRQYCDLDILIYKNDFDTAAGLLREFDYKSKLDYSISKEKIKELLPDHMFINNKNGVIIELHNKLFSSSFPIKIDNDIFFQNKTSIQLENEKVNIFLNEYLFIYLCLHGAKHLFSRISWVVDIDKLVNTSKLNWTLIDKLIKANNCTTIIYTSLFLSIDLLDTKLPDKIKNKYNFKYRLLVKLMKNNKIDIEFGDRFSLIHLLMFDSLKQKLSYLLYIFKPTFLDYQSLSGEYKFEIIYYIIRPFNLISRLFRK